METTDEPMNEAVLCEVCKVRYLITAKVRDHNAVCIECIRSLDDERPNEALQ